MTELKKIFLQRKKGWEYMLIYLDPHIIFFGTFEGSYSYQDTAEKFAQKFFLEDTLMKSIYMKFRPQTIMEIRDWIMGVLYHYSENSLIDIEGLTGYSFSYIRKIVRKFGPLRSPEEAKKLAFQKKYGTNTSDIMRERMREKWEEVKRTSSATEIMKKAREKKMRLYEKRFKSRAEKELNKILRKGTVSAPELGVSNRTMTRDLWRLRDKRMIVKFGSNKYRVTPTGFEFLFREEYATEEY